MSPVKQTRSSTKKMWWIVVTSIPFLIGLAIAFPFVAWAIIYNLHFYIPQGKWGIYDGMSVIVRDGQCNRLIVERPLPSNLYVQVGDRAILVEDLAPDDLKTAGFNQPTNKFNAFTKGWPSPVNSYVEFDQADQLVMLDLAHLEDVSLPFSSSSEGPFLVMPVSYKEFQAQFGKPKDWEYIYPSGSDPR